MGLENLAHFPSRDYCLEISGIPPSENCTSNDIVIAVGRAIDVSIKEEDISTSHPLPFQNSDTPQRIIVKFTRRDARNAFYPNRRKLINKKTNKLPELGLEEEEKIYISESLTRYKKHLFGDVNNLKKRLRWKHMWTQNGRIFLKEAERSKPVVNYTHEQLADFERSLRH